MKGNRHINNNLTWYCNFHYHFTEEFHISQQLKISLNHYLAWYKCQGGFNERQTNFISLVVSLSSATLKSAGQLLEISSSSSAA
jgi:hypothetical protein